jgi:protease IV
MRDVCAPVGNGLSLFLTLLLAAVLCGCSAPSFLVTPVSSSHTLKEEVVEPGRGFSPGKIAIIEVEGMLANARVGGLLQASENNVSLFTQELEKAETDPEVKAVVLRVNSPGGTVTAADTMYEQVLRFKQKTHKPVIASTQEVAASGAYYVSCAADKIVAQPTSVVGSIGVIFSNFDVTDGLARIGVQSRAVHSGTLKEMGSPFKHETPLESAVMQEMVNEYYIRFTTVVKQNRPSVKEMPPAPPATQPPDYAGVFSGRVWSGTRAVELGLADHTGLLSDAIDMARSAANAPHAKAVIYRRPYGYGGSIYADATIPQPQVNVLQLNLPGTQSILPAGFYYLWQP